MTTPNTPVVNKGLLYVNGLGMAPGALNADNLTTATVLISAGQARDSTDINDIVLPATVAPGAANPNNVPVDANAPAYTLNSAQTGAGGLDVGTIAIDLLYAVYVIASSNSNVQPSTLLSLSFTQPLLPFGYDMFRRVGAVLTAHANARFKWFDQRGRDMWYATNVIALAAGAATTLTSFNLSAAGAGTANQVPVTATKAYVLAALTADAGGTRTAVFSAQNTITIANGGAIGANPGTGEVIMSSPASTVTSASLIIPVSTTAGGVLPATSFYAVSNGAAALAVSVQGYIDSL